MLRPLLLIVAMTPTTALTAEFTLQSENFPADGRIPAAYTCEGEDRSPQLSWSGAPAGTRSFALIVDDPDAPDPAAPKMTWVHWVLYNLPAASTALADNAAKSGLPAASTVGSNDWKRQAWGGPCPPIGEHRYFFKLYALDRVIESAAPLDKPGLLQAMQGHVLGEAQLVGRYQKRSAR